MMSFKFVVVIVLLATFELLRRVKYDEPACPISQSEEAASGVKLESGDVVLFQQFLALAFVPEQL